MSLWTDLIQVFLGRPGGRRQSAGGFDMAADTVERTSNESLTSRCGQTAGDDGWPLLHRQVAAVCGRGPWCLARDPASGSPGYGGGTTCQMHPV
jgi:hypothetical protein